MGMSIEEAIKYYENKNVVLTEEEALANTLALNTMRKYQQLQADYENRLKADLMAMLEEIQLELDEMKITKVRSAGFAPYSKDPFRRGVNCSKEVIQQKINALKEPSNDD